MEVFSDRRMIRDLAVSLLCGAASLIGRDLMSRPLFDYLIIALVVLVPIISRRWPRLVVFVASVVLFASLFQVELTVGIIILAGQVAYIIRRRLEEPLRRVMTLGMLAADFVGVFWVSQTVQEAAQDIGRRLFVVGWSLLVLAVCMLVGELRRRAEKERTREISRALEKQRLEFEKSSTEQRAFIAREIHDVVTHSLSVIVAQADGALYTKDREAQEAALKSISRVGRTILWEDPLVHAIVAQLKNRSQHLRDNLASLTDDNGIANHHALVLDLELVVQGCLRHRRTRDEYRFHHCKRRNPAGTSHSYLNVQQLGGHLLRRVFISDVPRTALGHRL